MKLRLATHTHVPIALVATAETLGALADSLVQQATPKAQSALPSVTVPAWGAQYFTHVADQLDVELQDAYPLSTAQQGMALQLMAAPESTIFVEQLVFRITGDIDRGLWQRGWQHVMSTDPLLCSCFDLSAQPEPAQLVHKHVQAPVLQRSEFTDLDQTLQHDRERGMNLGTAPSC